MQTLNLRLTRDILSRPWGFRLKEESDTGYPFSVQRVFSGSPAEGILQRDDEVKILNNVNLENVSFKEVKDMIRTSGNQLNFIVVRDLNKIANTNDERVSVQNARLKFLNNENRSPQPFGQFGTQYQKKSNTLPTSQTIENRNNVLHENLYQKGQEMDDDDKADYSFMTLPVKERKKIFATPNENATSRTVPRQRSYSFRPTPTLQAKTQSAIYQKTPHEFGWGPSQEKIEKARQVRPNQSTVPLRYQAALAASPHKPKTNVEKISNTYFSGSQTSQTPRRYSSSATIPGHGRSNIHSYDAHCPNDRYQNQYHEDRVKSQKYVYHCGRNVDNSSVEPSIMVIPANRQPQQHLYINTYGTGTQYLSPSQSPRYFRPAYPAYSTEHPAVDSMSIISVRSEPYSKRLDRNIGYEKSGNYRIVRESSSVQRDTRDTPIQLGTLQIGEPRTRIIANPASPSFHLNRTFWGPGTQNQSNYEEPVQYFNMQASPVKITKRILQRGPSVPRSQSTIVMNPVRQPNDSVYSQVSWLKQHRDSLTGVSDF